MAKKQEDNEVKNQITKVGGAGPNVPAWMQKFSGDNDKTKVEMAEHRRVPRVKLIQGSAGAEWKKGFGEGDAVLNPGQALIVHKGEPFLFVPVKFAPEYCLWNDYKDKDAFSIEKRSFDKAGEIAKRAKDPDKRWEPYGPPDPKNEGKPKFKKRYVEHLNFFGFLWNHSLGLQLMTVDFSRGEHGQGEKFINALCLRPEPSFLQVWALTPAFRDRGDRKWWGFDYSPADPANVSEDRAQFFADGYAELTKLYEERRLIIERDDERADEEEDAAATKQQKF